jgi:hypothetical protein
MRRQPILEKDLLAGKRILVAGCDGLGEYLNKAGSFRRLHTFSDEDQQDRECTNSRSK